MYLSQPVERRGFGAHAPYAESESRIDAWDALENAETAAKLRAQLGSSPQAERLSAMLRLSSIASSTWYSRALGFVRRSQILSFAKSDAMNGMILRMLRRLPVR